jgi:hypothetical protein
MYIFAVHTLKVYCIVGWPARRAQSQLSCRRLWGNQRTHGVNGQPTINTERVGRPADPLGQRATRDKSKNNVHVCCVAVTTDVRVPGARVREPPQVLRRPQGLDAGLGPWANLFLAPGPRWWPRMGPRRWGHIWAPVFARPRGKALIAFG